MYSDADHPDLHSFPTRRSSDLVANVEGRPREERLKRLIGKDPHLRAGEAAAKRQSSIGTAHRNTQREDRKSTRLNSSHSQISYAVFCLKKKKSVEDRGGLWQSH